MFDIIENNIRIKINCVLISCKRAYYAMVLLIVADFSKENQEEILTLYVNVAESTTMQEKNSSIAKEIIAKAICDGIDFREMTYALMLENLRLHSVILDREMKLEEALCSNYSLENKCKYSAGGNNFTKIKTKTIFEVIKKVKTGLIL